MSDLDARRSRVSLPAAGGEHESELIGDLTLPRGRRGVVVFAHGSGSTRRSTRNRWVAARLAESGLGTLLMDLLSPEEAQRDEQTARLRFDIDLLTQRVVGVLDWIPLQDWGNAVSLGLFGASTGAAAALGAAAQRTEIVRAVVSRGGRPDLAINHLARVQAPTLLIVGGDDPEVLAFNREAAGYLQAPHELQVVSGAGHLFEEPGALDQVTTGAAQWFDTHLG